VYLELPFSKIYSQEKKREKKKKLLKLYCVPRFKKAAVSETERYLGRGTI
jgi:hypothetical protein